MFDNITYSSGGVIISVLIFVVALIFFWIRFFFNYGYVYPEKKLNRYILLMYRFFCVFSIVLVSLIPLNLSILKGKVEISKKTLNIQLLYDVSLSMTADDIKPSRFISAKKAVVDLVSNLKGYNISMIAFSGIPFTWSPFSDNTDALINKLNNMNFSDFPPASNFVGTAIGDAIMLGINNIVNISTSNKNPGIIILITDGDSNKGVDPMEAVKIASNNNIPIYTLGIGESDYLIGYDNFNSPVYTYINLDLLEDISEKSGGKFYRVLSETDFQNIFSEISNIVKSYEKTEFKNDYLKLNVYIYYMLILILSIILIFRIVLISKR